MHGWFCLAFFSLCIANCDAIPVKLFPVLSSGLNNIVVFIMRWSQNEVPVHP